MKPAYHIALTPAEKRLITELAAIQAQIEWLMQITVQTLINVKQPTARQIMGSTSLATNAEIWRSVVREKHPFADEVWPWVEYVFGEMGALAKGRNDFLHTLFGSQEEPSTDPGSLFFGWGHLRDKDSRTKHRAGVRVKNAAMVQLSELKRVRDHAAYISVAVAHIEWLAVDPLKEGGSPWLRRLGGPLPPLKGEAGFRKATRLPHPHQS